MEPSRRGRIPTGDLLPVFDFVAVLLAAYASSVLCSLRPPAEAVASFGAPESLLHAWTDRGNMALIGAALASYFLYDQDFTASARRRVFAILAGSYALRSGVTAACVAIIGYTTSILETLPNGWLMIWLGLTVLLTATLRLIVVLRTPPSAVPAHTQRSYR